MRDTQPFPIHSNFEILLDRSYEGTYPLGTESSLFGPDLCSLEPPISTVLQGPCSGLWKVLLCPLCPMALMKWVLETIPGTNLKAQEVSFCIVSIVVQFLQN